MARRLAAAASAALPGAPAAAPSADVSRAPRRLRLHPAVPEQVEEAAEELHVATSFVTQRDDRIDRHRAPRRDDGGGDGGDREQVAVPIYASGSMGLRP